jgi:hexosaminidase
MRLPFVTIIALSFCAQALLASGLWPIPRNLEAGNQLLKLSPAFSIQLHIPSAIEQPQDLLDAISRTRTRLQNDKLGRLTPGRGEEDREALVAAPSLLRLTLGIKGDGPLSSIASESVKDIANRDEKYSLVVPADGSSATITASSSLGLLRGLTTFEQLWYWVPSSPSDGSDVEQDGIIYAHQAPVAVKDDAPAFVSGTVQRNMSRCTDFSSHIVGSC